MRYQVDFLLPLKLQKISYYFGLRQKILLANQFAGFFTFDLCDLLILISWVHCYIVLVYFAEMSSYFSVKTKKKVGKCLKCMKEFLCRFDLANGI